MQDILEMIGGDGAVLPPAGAAVKSGRDFIRPGEARENLFQEDQLLLFQWRTVMFMRRSFPAFAKTLTEAELEKLALTARQRAAAKGFVSEREIWHYLIAIAYCGFFFEQDLQYADMLRLIGWQEYCADKMLLLDRLLSIIDEYALECEKDYADFDKKLQYLAEFYRGPQFGGAVLERLSPAGQAALGNELLAAIYPRRQELWTAETRTGLINGSLEHARRLGFGVKEGLVYAIAAIYFGRVFEQSPLYPWAYFLQNRNIAPAERIRHFTALLQKHLLQLAG